MPTPDPAIEVAARAMALHEGWKGWDTGSETLSGNDPEEERLHYTDLAEVALASLAGAGLVSLPGVDALAQFIRTTDGNHTLGAGLLAEHIHEWLTHPKKEPA